MDNTADFIELLKAVTVDSKDNGEGFVVSRRVEAIERLLDGTAYRLVAREPLALIYAKRELSAGDSVVLVSSHIDSLYNFCFCNDEGDSLRGTFDNSVGNAAILWLMLHDALPDNVVVAFTGDEERNSQGAVQTVLALGRMQCEIKFTVVLDVTNTGWENRACFALENDLGVDLITAHRIISTVENMGVEYAFKHDAEPDETWDYNDYGIPSLSVCAVAGGFLHGNEGVLLRKCSLLSYCRSVLVVLEVLA